LHGNSISKKFHQFDAFVDVMQRLGSKSASAASQHSTQV
jgi:hypothetical protein